MKSYYVYVLRCADDSFYVGVTNDLEFRFAQHAYGYDRRCYTYRRRPVVLAWSQEYDRIDDAIWCEKKLKGWSRRKKAALIAGDFAALREFSKSRASKSGPSSALRQAQGDKGVGSR